MKHPTNIEKYGGKLYELVNDIGNLRYDILSHFLKMLSDKIFNDAEKDKVNGKKLLSFHLCSCADMLVEAYADCDKAWDICKKYMEDDKYDKLLNKLLEYSVLIHRWSIVDNKIQYMEEFQIEIKCSKFNEIITIILLDKDCIEIEKRSFVSSCFDRTKYNMLCDNFERIIDSDFDRTNKNSCAESYDFDFINSFLG